jgi:hypothetical protein
MGNDALVPDPSFIAHLVSDRRRFSKPPREDTLACRAVMMDRLQSASSMQ